MTAPKIDTQTPDRAEVEELARQLDRGVQMDGKTVNCKHDACNCALMSDAAEMLRELLAERDLFAAREAAAAQAMREAAAKVAQDKHDAAAKWAAHYLKSFDGQTDSLRIAQEIAALHLPDPAALDRLIAEARRDVWDQAMRTVRQYEDEWPANAILNDLEAYAERDAARGSKEGRDG